MRKSQLGPIPGGAEWWATLREHPMGASIVINGFEESRKGDTDRRYWGTVSEEEPERPLMGGLRKLAQVEC